MNMKYRHHCDRKDRPVFNPAKITFHSQFDRNGRIAVNKEKQLSRASLSSESNSKYNSAGSVQAKISSNALPLKPSSKPVNQLIEEEFKEKE